MYPVAYRFHALAIQDAPKTRARIYFIGDGVDCTDDNDVQTNGTLLVGAAGDTDSNGRISQDGITFDEFFNPEKNLYVGDCVSSQISMTLLNYDGALDGFSFGRCKVYIDVYDQSYSTWLPCPMGVYILEQPTRTRQSLISVHGFDQMQRFDNIADSWWNALDWTSGLTVYDLVVSMAAQIGVSVSAATQTIMDAANDAPFYSPPTDCKNATYRSVLESIAEGCGSTARFDRDGALDLRWFKWIYSGWIDTDTIGNRCFSISISEQTVAKYGTLLYRVTSDDDYIPIVLYGDNTYRIDGNPFANPNNIDIINHYGGNTVLGNILRRLDDLGVYNPINGRFIQDWSIESGDIIQITNNGTAYTMPIFQQKMTWRGGYVVSEMFSDGDPIRPATDYRANEDFKTYSEKTRITDAEINATGWYRAIQYGSVSVPYSKGFGGIVFNIAITREQTAESHNIQYLASAEYDSNANAYVAKGFFANETSNAQNGYRPYCIDKIRYVYGDTVDDNGYNFAYIDIHMNYNAGQNNRVHFQFDCVTQEVDQSFAIAAGLTPVADTPANQIIQSVYSFSPVATNKIQKVATATLGSQNWYRVFSYNGSSSADVTGDNGVVAHLAITRDNDNDQSETHSIDLNIVNGNISFSNEKSVSSVLGVDKIRYTTTGYSPYNGYIEIHYNLNTENTVTVTCTVDGNVDALQRFNSISVISVPSPETIQAEYAFAKTGAVENLPAVFNSTLDVTNRRCYATLSSAGWYRAVTAAEPNTSGSILHFGIGRKTVAGVVSGQAHTIDFFVVGGGKSAFMNEVSDSNALYIDKIRCTYGNDLVHFDVHYSSSNSADVYVDFTVEGNTLVKQTAVAESLQAVADSPTGETVLTTYNFSADKSPGGFGTKTKVTTFPFTATTDGLFSVTLRASAQGRLYANWSGIFICDGYQVALGYVNATFPVKQGTILPSPTTSNVSASDYYWYPLG